MSSGRWLRELSLHQAIRNACCCIRSYETHAALLARRASPHIRNACCFTRSASITSHTRPASTLFSSNARIPRHRPCRPHRLRHPHLLLHRLFPHLHLSNPTESPTVAVLAAIATAVALTAVLATLAPATVATSPVASHSLGRSRAPSCCCCFCAARLRRCVGGANCNARSPGTSLRSASSLRR